MQKLKAELEAYNPNNPDKAHCYRVESFEMCLMRFNGKLCYNKEMEIEYTNGDVFPCPDGGAHRSTYCSVRRWTSDEMQADINVVADAANGSSVFSFHQEMVEQMAVAMKAGTFKVDDFIPKDASGNPLLSLDQFEQFEATCFQTVEIHEQKMQSEGLTTGMVLEGTTNESWAEQRRLHGDRLEAAFQSSEFVRTQALVAEMMDARGNQLKGCKACGTILIEAIRCDACRCVAYCSDTCQKKDSEAHKPLCEALVVAVEQEKEKQQSNNEDDPLYK